jgi:effector-binding domain-containing protein
MGYDVQIAEAKTIFTAVIRDRVLPNDLAKFVPAACGEVWTFIRAAELPRPGCHTALYLNDGWVEAGAEVPEPFIGNDRVRCSQLPSGRVAAATHFGQYQRLGEAHAAIRQWCDQQGRHRSNTCWEIYGHWDASWNDDPSKIRTDVFHLLEIN